LFKLEVPVRGRTVFAQSDREAALSPGDFTLLDLSRPCRLVDRGDEHGMVAVKSPHAALPLGHDELSRLTAMPMSGRDGLGTAISSLARHMARYLADHDETQSTRLATALMDLLIVTLAERLDRSATLAPATRRRAMLASVQAFIDQRLADPGLSPSAIAARWGLTDPAHFSRAFRAAYGLPPTEYRRASSTASSLQRGLAAP
jgi:AraC-like DNA-binding protein